MKLEETIKKFTNEEGEVDYSAMQKELDIFIGGVVSSNKKDLKDKYEFQLSNLKNDNENKDLSKDEMDRQIEELKKKYADLNNSMQQKEFKEKASSLNVDSLIIDTLIKSGANLSEIDLEAFKPVEAKKIEKMGETGDEEKEEKVDNSEDIKRLVELAKKGR